MFSLFLFLGKFWCCLLQTSSQDVINYFSSFSSFHFKLYRRRWRGLYWRCYKNINYCYSNPSLWLHWYPAGNYLLVVQQHYQRKEMMANVKFTVLPLAKKSFWLLLQPDLPTGFKSSEIFSGEQKNKHELWKIKRKPCEQKHRRGELDLFPLQ